MSLFSYLYQTWGQINSGIGIDYLKKMELINLELEFKFPTKKLNPQIILPLNISSMKILL